MRLRDQGFMDVAEGTIYALLVRIEQRGSFLAARLEQLREGGKQT
ncbi:hypothetical protein GCM10009530_77420 [Microbispora corallina]|uniref:PadR family transcriptional regulator n=1 Tax=Microbispora corallina TaxID=83302 RepID=A0ABQ4GCC1_9ACTN|nr:hypothetical protein Mco01_77310 [Microbispora corallina]